MTDTISQTPPRQRFMAYQGDPFDFEIRLSVDSQPADVDGWSWAADIETGTTPLSFECTGQPSGVALFLRGSDTARLPLRSCRFDVVGRNPEAGEGRTVLRGVILTMSRVTPPR